MVVLSVKLPAKQHTAEEVISLKALRMKEWDHSAIRLCLCVSICMNTERQQQGFSLLSYYGKDWSFGAQRFFLLCCFASLTGAITGCTEVALAWGQHAASSAAVDHAAHPTALHSPTCSQQRSLLWALFPALCQQRRAASSFPAPSPLLCTLTVPLLLTVTKLLLCSFLPQLCEACTQPD